MVGAITDAVKEAEGWPPGLRLQGHAYLAAQEIEMNPPHVMDAMQR